MFLVDQRPHLGPGVQRMPDPEAPHALGKLGVELSAMVACTRNLEDDVQRSPFSE